MPLYTIHHRPLIVGKYREQLAVNLTNLHSEVTGASSESVKIIFHQLDDLCFFSGGQRTAHYVRIIGQIRQGRSAEQKKSLLRGMYEIAKAARWSPVPDTIQTQIVEIDETETVMTNGVLNPPDVPKEG